MHTVKTNRLRFFRGRGEETDRAGAVTPSKLSDWRPAWEWRGAAACSLAAGWAAVALPASVSAVTAATLSALALWRGVTAFKVVCRRVPLAGIAPTFMGPSTLVHMLTTYAAEPGDPDDSRPAWLARYRAGRHALAGDVRFDATVDGRRLSGLWLGYGFEWKPAHAQALHDLAASRVQPVTLPDRVRKALGFPGPLRKGDIGSGALHGVGLDEEAPIVRPLKSLGGGTLIVGTTQAGKGVVMTSLIAQAILRGEPVVVIDPKSSKRLRGAIWRAARIAGRPAPLEFHPAFPKSGVRLDPLGAWTRPTEIATRIASVLPADSGAFGSFAWMAVNVAVEGLFYVAERPTLLGLRQLLEGGIDPLLEKALDKSFREGGVPEWRTRVNAMDPRDIHAPMGASVFLTASCLLWEDTVGKSGSAAGSAVIGGLMAVFRHNREHYAKITASLQPVLAMLTAGTLGKSFSPDPFDPDDERPIVTVERVIEGGGILYLGLDALPDSTVASAMGSIILADLTAYAGKRYNRGESGASVGRISLFVDETANVINVPLIELLNKGLEAGISVTAAMQTVADLSAKLGSNDRARMALGNFNNLIALRSKDRLTQDFVCETFGKTTIWQTGASMMSGADAGVLPDFRASVTRTISGRDAEVIPPDALGRLPNTEFFASVSGGRLYKGRMPIFVDDETEAD